VNWVFRKDQFVWQAQ
jgi:hypothetical protein